MDTLNDRQKRFCDEYLVDSDATKAALRAGYSPKTARNMLINETESITNCRNSVGLLSNRTIVEQHPWVTDAQTELARLAEEKAAQAQDSYTPTTFNT